MWRIYLVVIFLNSARSSTRTTYKIAITQKGFPQYLQYDIDTPPVREFTLCVWVRVLEFLDEQTIFTYAVHDNNRIMRLWIEEEGKLMKISIKDQAFSSIAVDLTRDTWHHVCLSYQSDFGAWALYFNGRLASCEAAQSILGYKLPAGGHFIFGYGISRNGSPSGFEGEIYGVNVLLISAVEKNHTLTQYYQSEKDNISATKFNNQFYDGVMKVLEYQKPLQTTKTIDTSNVIHKLPRNFIKFSTPYNQFEYDIGINLSPNIKLKNKTDVDYFVLPRNEKKDNSNIINFWEVLSKNKQIEQFGSHTKELPTVSEYETPPPSPFKTDHDDLTPKIKDDPMKTFFGASGSSMLDNSRNSVRLNTPLPNILSIETPPPVEKKNEVYGQWTTSSFAKDVLNYLKSIKRVTTLERKVPETIPLQKISDNFPYHTELKLSKISAPDDIRKKYFQHKINKRESKHPQINVEILENDIRSLILEEHAKTYPKNVKITYRGSNKIDKDHRFYRNVNTLNSEEIIFANKRDKLSYTNSSKRLDEIGSNQKDFYNNFINILPYLKSSQLLTAFDAEERNKILQKNKMYTNSLSDESVWHNINFHSSIFSPRDTNFVRKEVYPFIDLSHNHFLSKINKVMGLKHNPKQRILRNYTESLKDEDFHNVEEISNLSSPFDRVLLNSDNGLFADQTAKAVNTLEFLNKSTIINENNKNKFNQHVKIGNALNERNIIGKSGEKHKQSFVGGNENIPDIQRYRSDIDLTKDHVPPSLRPKVCREVEQLDVLFNLGPDVASEVILNVRKNYGVEFITANNKCLEQDVIFENRNSLLINWSETPVRLFGGAYPKKAVKLCGFF